MPSPLKNYWEVTKPGIIMGNLIPFAGGIILAKQNYFSFSSLVASFLGLWLVIAAGCVFNNILDRDIDLIMPRTKKRPIPSGLISIKAAKTYALILAVIGFYLLIRVNFLAFLAAAMGFAVYVFIYTIWLKKKSKWGIATGSIAGAMPPLIGYFSAGGKIDLAVLILFMIMVWWQMAHFLAIAVRRKDEYISAQVPIIPSIYSTKNAKIRMLAYIFLFTLSAPFLAVFKYTGWFYFWVSILLGLIWLITAIQGLLLDNNNKEKNEDWARKMFLLSLIVLVLLFTAIPVDKFIVR